MSGERCGDSKKGLLQGELFQTFLGGDLIKRMWEIKREDCRSHALPLQRGRGGAQWTIKEGDCFR